LTYILAGIYSITNCNGIVPPHCTEIRTAEIANTINDVLRPQGVGVIIKASHHCMSTRGVHKPESDLVTSRMLGCFRDNQLTRQEFLSMAV
jgi:GTP cyclohydrolase I